MPFKCNLKSCGRRIKFIYHPVAERCLTPHAISTCFSPRVNAYILVFFVHQPIGNLQPAAAEMIKGGFLLQASLSALRPSPLSTPAAQANFVKLHSTVRKKKVVVQFTSRY